MRGGWTRPREAGGSVELMEGAHVMACPRFADRSEAGRLLGQALGHHAGRRDLLVLALPPGGIPVGHEVARALGAPLDVFLVRRLAIPGREEIAIGALATGGARVLNEAVMAEFGVSDEQVAVAAVAEARELARDERLYRGSRAPLDASGRVVVLVDDGLAAGTIVRAAVAAIREQRPSRIEVAVPVGEWSVCATLEAEIDELTCLHIPEQLLALSLWYRSFEPLRATEVRTLLDPSTPPAPGAGGPVRATP
jgi:predicted phosphoribosyltransferase